MKAAPIQTRFATSIPMPDDTGGQAASGSDGHLSTVPTSTVICNPNIHSAFGTDCDRSGTAIDVDQIGSKKQLSNNESLDCQHGEIINDNHQHRSKYQALVLAATDPNSRGRVKGTTPTQPSYWKCQDRSPPTYYNKVQFPIHPFDMCATGKQSRMQNGETSSRLSGFLTTLQDIMLAGVAGSCALVFERYDRAFVYRYLNRNQQQFKQWRETAGPEPQWPRLLEHPSPFTFVLAGLAYCASIGVLYARYRDDRYLSLWLTAVISAALLWGTLSIGDIRHALLQVVPGSVVVSIILSSLFHRWMLTWSLA
ncbi:hypothetical protein F4777DRAFT_572717 [Nemania sp. FL0916]|nr:hypothetical protein F4777DRAFT_572717 [Nemania sp. FL0916]